jgi:enoyl-CoA hydratase/carnithine racemase
MSETPEFETLDLTIADGIATVRLSNEPVNAISQAMRHDLAALLATLEAPRVRVVVFTGTKKVFSVGADIGLFEEAQDWTTQEFRANSRVLGGFFDGLEAMEKPVLAAIEGTCVGGGLELALACDVRIVHPEATLGFPEHNIGLLPGLGGSSRFVRLVGHATALDLVWSKELFDGERAKELGACQRVAEDPEAAAAEYAANLLDQPPQAVGLVKKVMTAARDADVETAGLLESLAQSTLIKTEDHAEGIDAFRADRDPEFTGR